MLCLSRTKEERIVILDEHGSLIASIIIIDIRGDKVRMGFDADSKITIHRKEVYDAIRRENRAAAQVKPEDVSGVAGKSPAANPGAPKQGDASKDDPKK